MKPTPTPPPMAEQLVPDDIWDAIAPLLPAHPPQPNGGRPWISDRAVLGGLIYVLRSSPPWRLLPARPGAGLRQPGHLLAAAAGLASRRGLGAAAPSAVGLAG